MLTRGVVESELMPFYPKIGTTTWSPLAGGALSGKYGSDESKWDPEWRGAKLEHVQVAQQLFQISERLGCTLAQLAIAWCCVNPNISTVIMGFTRISQLENNLGALAAVPLLTDDVLAEIEDILGNQPVPNGAGTMAQVGLRRDILETGTH